MKYASYNGRSKLKAYSSVVVVADDLLNCPRVTKLGILRGGLVKLPSYGPESPLVAAEIELNRLAPLSLAVRERKSWQMRCAPVLATGMWVSYQLLSTDAMASTVTHRPYKGHLKIDGHSLLGKLLISKERSDH